MRQSPSARRVVVSLSAPAVTMLDNNPTHHLSHVVFSLSIRPTSLRDVIAYTPDEEWQTIVTNTYAERSNNNTVVTAQAAISTSPRKPMKTQSRPLIKAPRD
ncbi:hypothetical protein LSAT2_017009 [Lamellibrachia satsuma]|nr:hypothetical protein LSAT2_017009 [Lamellibrachia satsuma]